MTDQQQIEMFPTVLRLRRTDPEGAVRRFYLVTVQPDLFGGAALVVESGQLGCPGSTTTRFFPDEGQAVDALAEVVKRKVRLGYLL
ncbi:WGR domain-containing protein [Puniceibacterium antarcticum]|nr:WGR domain-containing protein [Puniceibacterium antarcticum]